MKKLLIVIILLSFSFSYSQSVAYKYKITVPKNNINIRVGPGTNYAKDSSGQLVQGEILYILEERNGWIKFRVTPKDVGWTGWVLKRLVMQSSKPTKSTYTSKPRRSVNYQVIRDLKTSGFLVRLNLDLNEAWVDPLMWHNMTYETKRSACVIFAKECDFAGSTNRITIKDNYTGKKLAKYSQVYGLKVY